MNNKEFKTPGGEGQSFWEELFTGRMEQKQKIEGVTGSIRKENVLPLEI